MHGLEQIKYMNELAAAEFLKKRYEKLRGRAVKREDWVRAKRYDREVTDLGRFIAGTIPVFPNRSNRKLGLYQPSEGRDFRRV
ncbi:MAG: hypothetical protein HYV13_00720 [Candidatus Doudnabacteria bacterium]|nr:hypothetical protein [Candidatus Doudnabacteria bacterium]